MKYFRYDLLASVSGPAMIVSAMGGFNPRRFTWRFLQLKAQLQ